jgi:hypothetical protein
VVDAAETGGSAAVAGADGVDASLASSASSLSTTASAAAVVAASAVVIGVVVTTADAGRAASFDDGESSLGIAAGAHESHHVARGGSQK